MKDHPSFGRRRFLGIAAAGGALALAGCTGGGDGGGDGSGTTTAGSGGQGAGTNAGGGGGCGGLTAGGYRQYDASGKPIFFTFDYPEAWSGRGTELTAAYFIRFDVDVEVGDESLPFTMTVAVYNDPQEEPDSEFIDALIEGGEERSVPFGGEDNRFAISGGYLPSSWTAIGFLPFGTGADRTYHFVDVTMIADEDSEGVCADESAAIRDHLFDSIVPNENHTFTPEEA